jgi:hypothetical protein
LLDVLISEHPGALVFLVTVNARTQRLGWHAMVYGMICRDNGRNHERLFASECWRRDGQLESG